MLLATWLSQVPGKHVTLVRRPYQYHSPENHAISVLLLPFC